MGDLQWDVKFRAVGIVVTSTDKKKLSFDGMNGDGQTFTMHCLDAVGAHLQRSVQRISASRDRSAHAKTTMPIFRTNTKTLISHHQQSWLNLPSRYQTFTSITIHMAFSPACRTPPHSSASAAGTSDTAGTVKTSTAQHQTNLR